MNDWVDYFENFPEEDPGNYVNGVFDPINAKLLRKPNVPYITEHEKKLRNEQYAILMRIKGIKTNG